MLKTPVFIKEPLNPSVVKVDRHNNQLAEPDTVFSAKLKCVALTTTRMHIMKFFSKENSMCSVLYFVCFRSQSTAKVWCTPWFCCWLQSHLLWVVHSLCFHTVGNTRVDLWLCYRKVNCLCLCPSLIRSCVCTWTTGGWTAGWDSVSCCCMPSSSSAPLALRGCRGHTLKHTHPTQKTRTVRSDLFSTFIAAIMNQMYRRVTFHFISKCLWVWAALLWHWLPESDIVYLW